MKNTYILLLFSVLSVFSLSAQTPSVALLYKGQPIVDGSTLTVSDVSYEDLIGGVTWKATMTPDLALQNLTQQEVTLSLACEPASGNINEAQFVWGDAYQVSQVDGQTLATFTLPAGATDSCNLQLQKQVYVQEFYTPTAARLTVSVAEQDETLSVNLVFDNHPTAVAEVFSQRTDRVEVYNLCGKKVADTLEGLKSGIYIVKQNGLSRKTVIN